MIPEHLDRVELLTRKVARLEEAVNVWESNIIEYREKIRQAQRVLGVDNKLLQRARSDLDAFKSEVASGSVVEKCWEMCQNKGVFCTLPWGHTGAHEATDPQTGGKHVFRGGPG